MSLRGWLFRRRGREEELDEEIQSHLRMAAQQRMERGETAEGAGVSAAREFGNVTLIKEMLLAFVNQPMDGATRQAFVTAAERIRSTHDQNRVLAALVKSERR